MGCRGIVRGQKVTSSPSLVAWLDKESSIAVVRQDYLRDIFPPLVMYHHGALADSATP